MVLVQSRSEQNYSVRGSQVPHLDRQASAFHADCRDQSRSGSYLGVSDSVWIGMRRGGFRDSGPGLECNWGSGSESQFRTMSDLESVRAGSSDSES
uniref:Uncharacterized protein n=1 Tax=Cannabis sativa TaxID=3483 RepID=A0A803QRV9_CANSA